MTAHILNDLPQQKVSGSIMKHPLLGTARSLTGMALVLLGLSTYGCGDSGTATEPAELGNLSASVGDLQPAFNPATTSYTVQLPTDVSSTIITASPRVAGDTIRIDNQQISSQTITLNSPGAEQSVSIVVTDTGTGGTSKSYTVQVKRATLAGNNSLANLTVSPGILAPDFDKSSTRYTVSVGNNVGSITITPTLSDPAATMTVSGQPALSGQARRIDLNGGGQITTIPIAITAQDGSIQSYEVAVSRGPSNNNNLQGLTISSGNLDPSFRANRTAYTVNVGSSVTSVTVRPTLADTTANMTVNGQATTSGQQSQTITLNGPGSSTVISIIVIAQNGTPKPYSVNIVRAALGGNNNLSALAVSLGTLDPAFSASTTSYTVDVASSVSSVTVTPTRQDSNATITVNGQAATSGQGRAITLNGTGSNTVINIVVTAQNGTPRTYTVNVARAALGGNNNLSGLTVSSGSLDPAFNTNSLDYTVDVASTVTSITVTPRLQDSAATMTVNGQATTSGQGRAVTLNGAGSNTVINIVVTAPNGTQRTYTVNVARAALGGNNNLSGLSLSPGTLNPTFRADRIAYTVNVGSNVASLNVTATVQDAGASLTMNNQGASSGQPRSIPLDPPGTTTELNVVVNAPNGNSKTYQIDVIREALGGNNNLQNLSVSPGSLTPAFTPDTLAYSVDVSSDTSSINVAATKADPSAVISGDLPNDGQATIQLDGGPSTRNISIIVTAPNQTSKNYTVTVNRAAPSAPPAPANAPDLIPADDSGFLPGQNSDNITNVTTPRFQIQPRTGETPSLYVDGSKVSATFNQGANTLQPTSPLSDGAHSVTYTMTNSSSLESAQSPTLSVTIDTVGPVTP